jgi:hypothetical protein
MKVKRGQDWTALLDELGLTSPGYDEAVIATAATVARRKLIEKNRDEAKMKGKKRRGR